MCFVSFKRNFGVRVNALIRSKVYSVASWVQGLTLLLGLEQTCSNWNRHVLGNYVSGVCSAASFARESIPGFLVSNWKGVIQVRGILVSVEENSLEHLRRWGFLCTAVIMALPWWRIGMKWLRLR